MMLLAVLAVDLLVLGVAQTAPVDKGEAGEYIFIADRLQHAPFTNGSRCAAVPIYVLLSAVGSAAACTRSRHTSALVYDRGCNLLQSLSQEAAGVPARSVAGVPARSVATAACSLHRMPHQD